MIISRTCTSSSMEQCSRRKQKKKWQGGPLPLFRRPFFGRFQHNVRVALEQSFFAPERFYETARAGKLRPNTLTSPYRTNVARHSDEMMLQDTTTHTTRAPPQPRVCRRAHGADTRQVEGVFVLYVYIIVPFARCRTQRWILGGERMALWGERDSSRTREKGDADMNSVRLNRSGGC